MEPGYTLCWAAKWHGEKGVHFNSRHQSSERAMIREIYRLIDDADVVVHYNGRKFDMPTLNREFLKIGLTPPSPYKEVDMLSVARQRFRFPSNKLDYVARALGVGKKVKHMGYELWTRCMAGDDKAWRVMERYNRGDVTLLEKVYDALLPWINHHPNYGLYEATPRPVCRNCGKAELQRRGTDATLTCTYPRYRCTACGRWQRGAKKIPNKGEAVMR